MIVNVIDDEAQTSAVGGRDSRIRLSEGSIGLEECVHVKHGGTQTAGTFLKSFHWLTG